MTDMQPDPTRTPPRSSRTRLVAAVVGFGLLSTLAGSAAIRSFDGDSPRQETLAVSRTEPGPDVSPLWAATEPPVSPLQPATEPAPSTTATTAAVASPSPAPAVSKRATQRATQRPQQPAAEQEWGEWEQEPAQEPPPAQEPAPAPAASPPPAQDSNYPALQEPTGGYNNDLKCRRTAGEFIYTWSYTVTGTFFEYAYSTQGYGDTPTRIPVGYDGASNTRTYQATTRSNYGSEGIGLEGQGWNDYLEVDYSDPSADGAAGSWAWKRFETTFTFPACP